MAKKTRKVSPWWAVASDALWPLVACAVVLLIAGVQRDVTYAALAAGCVVALVRVAGVRR